MSMKHLHQSGIFKMVLVRHSTSCLPPDSVQPMRIASDINILGPKISLVPVLILLFYSSTAGCVTSLQAMRTKSVFSPQVHPDVPKGSVRLENFAKDLKAGAPFQHPV